MMKKIFFLCVLIPTLSFCQGKFFGGDGSGYASSTIEIATLSVPTLSQDKVTIYPNPVVSTIHLSKETTGPMVIADVNGKIVLRFKPNQSIINVSKLSQGVYFLKYKNEVHRFIKK